MSQCPAETRVKRNYKNHTFRCAKPEGHHAEADVDDSAHVSADGTVRWYGEPRQVEGNTNHRYGFSPGWQMR